MVLRHAAHWQLGSGLPRGHMLRFFMQEQLKYNSNIRHNYIIKKKSLRNQNSNFFSLAHCSVLCSVHRSRAPPTLLHWDWWLSPNVFLCLNELLTQKSGEKDQDHHICLQPAFGRQYNYNSRVSSAACFRDCRTQGNQTKNMPWSGRVLAPRSLLVPPGMYV